MVTPVLFQTPVKVGFFSAVMMCDGRFHCWWESPGVKPWRHVYLSSCSNGLDTVFTINIGTSQLPCKLFLKSFKNDEVKFCKPRPEYSYAGCLILVDTTCSCLLIFRIRYHLCGLKLQVWFTSSLDSDQTFPLRTVWSESKPIVIISAPC